jgi:hypothetical protein
LKKTIIYVFIFICGIVSFIALNDLFNNKETNIEQKTADQQEPEMKDRNELEKDEAANEREPDKAGENAERNNGLATEKRFQMYEEEGVNPFGDDLKKDELTDDDIRTYIHAMSHQKVEAEEKWGFYEIHEKRINWLLEGLEETSGLTDKETYKEILTKWDAGDFSTADKDHNVIWEMRGGDESEDSLGKATHVLSKEEEEEYLNIRK